ncbi:MAG: hypothetical protein M3Y59_00295 [Myxococcota bacterium]|nr:hypothetical protein [Myxococcota bacterium]
MALSVRSDGENPWVGEAALLDRVLPFICPEALEIERVGFEGFDASDLITHVIGGQ